MVESIILATGIGVAFLVLATLSRRRYQALAHRRSARGQGFDNFRGDLMRRVPDEQIIETVYIHFSKIASPPIPVLPDDGIEDVYGIVGEDIREEISELAEKCGVVVPSSQHLSAVETVADAATLLYSLKRRDCGGGKAR